MSEQGDGIYQWDGRTWMLLSLALKHGLLRPNERTGAMVRDIEDRLFEESDRQFHIGQNYRPSENTKARGIKCGLCGSDQFNVGLDSYFTAIRCVNCGWEHCIHEG